MECYEMTIWSQLLRLVDQMMDLANKRRLLDRRCIRSEFVQQNHEVRLPCIEILVIKVLRNTNAALGANH